MDSSDDSDREEDHPVRLVDGVDLRELIDTSSATFEVKLNEEAALEEQQLNYFNSEDLMSHINLDCIDPLSDDENAKNGESGAPGDMPFERLASRMTNLIDNGKVKKRIIREGVGEVVPEDAMVWIHYNGYLEFGDEPYDSTYLRGRPHRVRLNQGQLFGGLEIGISSMKKTEIAQFLIHPDLGFGNLGSPPRIPGGAELLIHVELVKYMDNAGAAEVGALTAEEREKLGFPAILKAAKGLNVHANDLFKKNVLSTAISKYKKAVDILEPARLANEEEQAEHQKLLLKLYINLAICYNKQKVARHACVMCQRALQINPNSAKALFQYGKAQIALGGLDKAENLLKRAHALERHNGDINAELRKLEAKKRAYKADSSDFAKKAFQNLTDKVEELVIEDEEEAKKNFSTEIVAFVQDFIADPDQTSIPIPPGCTHEERMLIKNEAERLDLLWDTEKKDDQTQCYIRKSPQRN